jgi:hypothetical protein
VLLANCPPLPSQRPGKYLEAHAKGRTSSAISELLRLAPATAILLHTDDQVPVGGPWAGLHMPLKAKA